MATTIAHGTIGVTACVAATIAPFGFTPITIGLAMISSAYAAYHSMRPDIFGIKGGSARAVKNWDTYEAAHYGFIAESKRRLPNYRPDKWFYILHLWLDRFFHRNEPPYGWLPLGYVLEVLLDVMLVFLLVTVVGWFGTVCIVLILGLYVLIVKLESD